MMKHFLRLSLLLFPTCSFSAVVLELDANSLVNPTVSGNTRATLSAQGTIVDESDTTTPLSNVTFEITPQPGVAFGETVFFDNNVNNHFEDNSLARWSGSSYQNADGSRLGSALDALGLRTSGAIETKGLLSMNFTQGIEGLVIHFWQIDAGDVLLTSVNGSTTGFTASELSGTIATIPTTNLGPGTELNAGSGSIQLITNDGSPITSVGLTTVKDRSGIDGWSLFLSGTSVVPEPSSSLLLGLTSLVLFGRRNRRR